MESSISDKPTTGKMPTVDQGDKTSLSRDAIMMFGVSIMMALLNIGTGIYIAKQLPPYDYGRLIYFSNTFLLAMLLIGFGLTARISSEMARVLNSSDQGHISQVFYSMLTLRVLTAAPIIILGVVGYLITYDSLYIYIGANAGMAVTMDFLLGVLQGLQFTKRAAAAYLSQPAIYLVLLLSSAAHNAQAVIIAITISFTAAVVVLVVYLIGTGISRPQRALFSWAYIRQSLVTSGQIYGIALVQMAYGTYALIWLGSLGRYTDVAQLGAPLTLVRLLPLTIGPVISTVYYPRLCTLISANHLDQAKKQIAFFFEGTAILALCSTVIMMAYPTQIINLFYSAHYLDSWTLLCVLAPMTVILSVESILTMTMLAIGRARFAVIALSVRFVVFMLSASVILLQSNANASLWLAVAYLVSALLGLILQWRFYLQWSGRQLPLIWIATSGGLFIAVTLAIRYLLPDITGAAIIEAYKAVLSGVCASGLGLGLYLVRRTSLRNRLRSASLFAVGLLLLSLLFGHSTVAQAQEQAEERCNGTLADEHWIIVDCNPGFVTKHDRIRIYARDGVKPGVPWDRQLNDTNAVWIFEVGATDQAKLIINFHSVSDQLVADLYDDGDQNNAVDYTLQQGNLSVQDHAGRWTVQARSRDGWWRKDNMINFNLDILIDGPLRGSFGADFLYPYADLLHTDGRVDYDIHVRDSDRDGRPDYEWRQDRPPLPEDSAISGYYRTSIMSNTNDDEVPISGAVLWPFLSRKTFEFVKSYNTSPPPVQVDWTRAKLVQVAEFVASRGNPGNYFVYSIERVQEGKLNDTNFENPFAFYDLAQANDGWPDTAVRVETIQPHELLQIKNQDQINIIEYAWGKQHNHSLNYQVSLVGRQPIDKMISFPEFSIKAVPFQELPRWVSDRSWDAATFVEVENQPYWTAEDVYEWNIEEGEKVLPFRYVTGFDSQEPTKAFEQIVQGFRGEYTFDLNAQPHIYFSPIDRKLHLLKATGGVWQIDQTTVIRYANLGGDYINSWKLFRNKIPVAMLYAIQGHLLLSDEQGIHMIRIEDVPALFTTLPPTNHDEWVALGHEIDINRRELLPTNFSSMLAQFGSPTDEISHASIADLRLEKNGFRFVLDLKPGFSVEGTTFDDAANLESGAYVVTFDGTFHIEPLTPPAITAALPTTTLGQLQRNAVPVQLRNDGRADVLGATIELWAAPPQGQATLVTTQTVALLAQTTVTATLQWQPQQAGNWNLTARVLAQDGNELARQISVAGVPAIAPAGSAELLGASNIGTALPFVALIAVGFALIAALSFRQQLARSATQQVDDAR